MPTKLREKLPENETTQVQHFKFVKAYDSKYRPGEKDYLHIFKYKGGEHGFYANFLEHEFFMSRGQTMIKATAVGNRVFFPEMNADPVPDAPEDILEEKQIGPQEEGIDKDLWISHQGWMQAHICAGRPNVEALKLAKEAYDLLRIDLLMRK